MTRRSLIRPSLRDGAMTSHSARPLPAASLLIKPRRKICIISSSDLIGGRGIYLRDRVALPLASAAVPCVVPGAFPRWARVANQAASLGKISLQSSARGCSLTVLTCGESSQAHPFSRLCEFCARAVFVVDDPSQHCVMPAAPFMLKPGRDPGPGVREGRKMRRHWASRFQVSTFLVLSPAKRSDRLPARARICAARARPLHFSHRY